MHTTSTTTPKPNRATRRRVTHAAMAGLLLATIGLAGCGDDDDDSADEGSAATTTPVAASNTAFCDGFVEADSYFSNLQGPPDEAKATELLGTVTDAAPDEISDQVTAMVDGTKESFANEGETSSEFDAAYADVSGWIGENCGFESLELDAKEYEFSGVPKSAKAGTTAVALKNSGAELHEAIMVRINDGVTETLEEIAALPEEEAMGKITMVGQTFALPGETGHGVVQFSEPGTYGVICFIPQGLTPEAAATAESSGAEPEGAPHFTLGMVQQFEVK